MSDKQEAKPKIGIVMPSDDECCVGAYEENGRACAVGHVLRAYGEDKTINFANPFFTAPKTFDLKERYFQQYGNTPEGDNDENASMTTVDVIRRMIALSDDLIELPKVSN